jgi:hypothetical protein
MPTRKLRIVRFDYPLTGICEHCNQTFLSRDENLYEAGKQIQAQFDAHKCTLTDSSQNALRIVRESTEGK